MSNVDYIKGDYQLIFCSQSKKALIKENSSTNTLINKEITLFKRVPIYFGESNNTPIEYTFESYEQVNQKNVDNLFSYVGEIIQVFPKTYESMNCAYLPILGMSDEQRCETISIKVIVENNEKYVLLPRYISSNNQDLLDETIVFDNDIFSKYKSDFLNAYYKEYAVNSSLYIYGLYDY